ncbi:hypothetical protein ACVJGC_000827 [Bradyrhizobium diazoefficiens]
MLKTIILLTQTVQQQRPLANLLREFNPDLAFCSALSAQDLAAIAPDILRDARLVSFANDIPVSQKFLLRLGHGAYKFHVAPVQYPGLPASHDDSEDPRCFSAIAQSIAIWPDCRHVVGLETVTVPDDATPAERERLIFTRLAHLFWRMSSLIATDAELRGIIDSTESKPTFAQMNLSRDPRAEPIDRRSLDRGCDDGKIYATRGTPITGAHTVSSSASRLPSSA